MKIIEKQGYNIQDLIEKFKKQEKLNDHNFIYEVLQEPKKGFLGFLGGQKAIVKFIIDDLEKEIKEYLREFALHAQIKIRDFSITRDEKFIYVDMDEVSDPGFFIGKDGNFINNLQHLVNLTFASRLVKQKSIVLDVAGYKKRQNDQIMKKVHHLAQQALKTKKAITLDPMSSAQRRIVHQAIQDHKSIKTMTIGDGPNKRIILSPIRNHLPQKTINRKTNTG